MSICSHLAPSLGQKESNSSLREPTLGLHRATEAKKEGMSGLKEPTFSLKEGTFLLRERMSSLKEGTSGQKEPTSYEKESKPTLLEPSAGLLERWPLLLHSLRTKTAPVLTVGGGVAGRDRSPPMMKWKTKIGQL